MTSDRGWRMSPVFVLRHAGMPFDWFEELGFSDDLVALADQLLAADNPPLRDRFVRDYERHRGRLRSRLHALAQQEEFCAAVFLSNPAMYDSMLRGYLARDQVPDNSRFRRVERQVYLYLQRFCGKNETASTFGPMGYGEVDDGVGLRVERERAPARRSVQLARWALEELARAVARNRELRAHVPLQRSLLVEDSQLTEVAGESLDDAAVIAWKTLCDRRATLAELAAAARLPVGETLKALRPLLACGAVHRGLLFAADVVNGLRELRDAVAALPDLPARDRWLAELDTFADDCVAFAAAQLERRGLLLTRMESRFSALTGVAARRGAGDIYADRLILFEEASSPFRLKIGTDLSVTLDRLVSAGLDLSAMTGQQIQYEYQRRVADIVRRAGRPLSFVEYAELARPSVALRSTFDGHAPDLIVPADPGQDVDVVAPDAELIAPRERYALPDICLLAPDPHTFSAQPRVLLARVHHHLLLNGWLTTFIDNQRRVDEQVQTWLTGSQQGRATAALATSRRNKGFYRFPGRHVIITPVDHEGRSDVLPATTLTVHLDGDRPRLAGPDNQPIMLYPMLADLTTYPPIAALTSTPVLHRRMRPPDGVTSLGRVRVGGAIYQRAYWELPLAELAEHRGVDAFLLVRALATRLGLPRFVFVRVESERKPLLIDTRSPFAVDVLCHLAKENATARAEEMLPGPDELWLADERGRYTCELRVQFLRSVQARDDSR